MNVFKKYYFLALFIAMLSGTHAFAELADGMTRVKSASSVSVTLDKLEAVLKKKGMTIFTRVPHSKAGAKVGLEIRETELLIFGNPKIGTQLMQCQQTAAIDLPMKALAYKDESGQVWLAYNDPQYLADRHHAKDCKVVARMTKALANFSKAATQ